MPFNSEKVARLIRARGIKAKEFFAICYPDRTGNTSFSDIAKNDNPKAAAIERIADLLHCSIDELFDRETSQPAPPAGDYIEANDNAMAFKGSSTCDPRLLSLIETRDRQLDATLLQLDKAQQQSDRLLALLEAATKK